MIDARDVRIGNWLVNFLGEYFQVNTTTISALQGVYPIEFPQPEPIPISADLLLKFGFTKEEKPSFKGVNFFVLTYDMLTCNSIHGWWIRGMQMDYQIEWVHQLQNLYFALTQKELPINL